MPVFNVWADTAYIRATAQGTEDCSSHANACDDWYTAEAYAEVAGDPKILIFCGDSITDEANPDADSTTIGSYYYDSGEIEVTDAATLSACGTKGKITRASDNTINITATDVDDLTIRYLWIENTGTGRAINDQSNCSGAACASNHVFDNLDIDADAGGADGLFLRYVAGYEITNSNIVASDIPISIYGHSGATQQVSDGTISDNIITCTAAGCDEGITVN